MLWKTHLRISFEVLRILGVSLSGEVAQSFKDGILAPDHWRDYPHHYGKSDGIKEYLLKSRERFLQDDFPRTFFNLGVALHYIQDSYTSMASFYPKHQSWEEDIEYAPFTNSLERAIANSLINNQYERDRCLQLANILSTKAQGRDNTLYIATLSGQAASKSFAKPIVDLNLGLKASLVVAESVLGPKDCPTLENKLREELADYEALMKTAEAELTEKIIGLVEERDNLERRIVPQTGMFSKMGNWILGIRIAIKDYAVNSNNNNYNQQKHLKKVVTMYVKAAKTTVIPYTGWYNFQIPEINPYVVERELLPVQEITEGFGQSEHVLRESMSQANVSTYRIGDRDLVRRAELHRLHQSSVKERVSEDQL